VSLVARDTGQADSRPTARLTPIHRGAVDLDRSHAADSTAGQQRHFVSDPNSAGPGGSRNHRAHAGEGERPVHGEPEQVARRARHYAASVVRDQPAQLLHARAGACGDGHGWAKRDRRPGQPFGQLRGDQLQPVAVHQVDLAQHRNAVRHTEMLQDREVLECLRHDALVRRDDQEGEVHARRAGHHGAHEVFVARHVHEAGDPAAAQIQRSEVQVDGDPAPPLLRKAVHGPPGKGRHQRRLPVVDVPGGPDDHAAIQGRRSQNSSAGSSAPSPR
jgi:hypothetical protein